MSGPWERFASAAPAGPWVKFQPQAQGESDAAANAFGQGATFNAGDELAAGVRAIAPDLSNWMMRGPALQRDESIGGSPKPQTVSTAPDVQGRYDEELAKIRGQTKADSAAYPWMTTGANIAGNVASTVAMLPAAAMAMGPSLLGNAAKMAATGGVLGGAAGFGEGEGGFENRMGSAVLPAAVGTTLGGATPFVGALARSLMESRAGRAVSNSVAESGAMQRLATMLQRAKLDPTQAEGRMAQLGEGAMIADVGPEFAQTARAMRALPGQTKTLAPQVMEDRANQEASILRRAFEGDTPPPSRFELTGDKGQYATNTRAVGRQAYQGDMVGAGLNQTPELQALMQQPEVAAAYKRVTDSIAKATAGRPTAAQPSPIEVMHMVKQEISKIGQDATTGRPLPTQQVWRDLADEYVSTLKSANPELAKADAAYAHSKSLPEHFDVGHNFLSGATTQKGMESSAPAVADLLSRASPAQTGAVEAGSTNAVRELTSGRNAVSQTRAIARDLPAGRGTDQGIAPIVERIYGPRAEEIQRAGNAVRTYQKTDRIVMGGSPTDINLLTANDAGNASVRLSPGGVQPRLIEKLGNMLSSLVRPNEAVRDEIGKALLNPNSEKSREILARVAALLQGRASGSPITAGLIEGAASQAGAQ